MFSKIIKRDGRTVDFNSKKITNAIAKAGKSSGEFGKATADKLSIRVLDMAYHKLKNKTPTVEQIQDIVEDVLITRAYNKTAKAYIIYRYQHKQLRDIKNLLNPIDIIDAYLSRKDWLVKENSNMSFSVQGLNNYISKKMVSQYWLEKVYTDRMKKAHISGDLHIHDLDFLGAYTYYGKEVVIAKIGDKIKLLNFEQLFNTLPDKPVLLNERDGAYAKFPKNVYVLDKDGWVKVKKVVQKKKNRPMHFIKNRGGRSIIVTDNHPMITYSGEKEAKNVNEDDFLFTADVAHLLKKEELFFTDRLDLLDLLQKYEWKGDKLHYDGVPLKELDENIRPNGIVHTQSFISPRYIYLTESFGYFVGFTLAEGYISYDRNSSHRISLSQKIKEPLIHANKGLLDNGLSGILISDGKRYELRVKNPFIRFLFEQVFSIKPGACHKNLPVEILHYSVPFIKGIIAGLIDGDGSIETSKTTLSLRIAARTLLEQLAIVMELLGFTPRDRAIEGQGTEHIYKGKKIIQRYPIYGISFRKIRETLPSEKYYSAIMSTKAWQDEGKDEWHRVLNNKPVEIPDETIYDITTESGTLIVNGMWNHNCVGWDLKDLLTVGFKGVEGKIESKPAKHFRSAMGQIVNFFYTLQGEAAGAQAFSNFDTLLSPFIHYDNLSYPQVKQAMQEFLFNMNVPTRVGFQSPYTNITLDLQIPEFMKNESVIIGGQMQKEQYGNFQKEMYMFDRAFFEVAMEGDAKGRPFTFPIPTVNIAKDFDWDNPEYKFLWKATGKYGLPYFSNFINSDMKPEDARSMCCRLRIDNRELRKKGGGLFGANPLTGSLGVVTINMPRIGYISKTKQEFYERLEDLMVMAKDSLETKRKTVENLTNTGLFPYSKFYLRDVYNRFNEYWKNHFSTIGLAGMNEALLNFEPVSDTIGSDKGEAFTSEVMDFMRGKLIDFQEETGNNYNLEATPAEGTSHRLALLDKRKFPDIITQGKEDTVYYTNSTQLPVNFTDDVFEVLDLQDDIQCKYTGGTVIHIFVGEKITNYESVKLLIKQIFENYKLPYISITPTFSICPIHGYIAGEHKYCPICKQEKKDKIDKEIINLEKLLEVNSD